MEKNNKKKVIFDTDIGEDIDDAWALAMLVNSEEVDLLGVTTGYRDVRKKALFAKRIMDLSRKNVPVFYGIEKASGNADGYMSVEDYNFLDEEDFKKTDEELGIKGGGVDFIARSILGNRGKITLIGTGPSTNIAKVIEEFKYPKQYIKEIYLMAGCISTEGDDWKRPEYNLRKDIGAFKTIAESGVPMTIVGKDSRGIQYERKDIEVFNDKKCGSLSNIIYYLTNRYFDFKDKRGWSNVKTFWDPVAVGAFLFPDLYSRSCIKPEISKDGRMYAHQVIPSKSSVYGIHSVDYEDLKINIKGIITDYRQIKKK